MQNLTDAKDDKPSKSSGLVSNTWSVSDDKTYGYNSFFPEKVVYTEQKYSSHNSYYLACDDEYDLNPIGFATPKTEGEADSSYYTTTEVPLTKDADTSTLTAIKPLVASYEYSPSGKCIKSSYQQSRTRSTPERASFSKSSFKNGSAKWVASPEVKRPSADRHKPHKNIHKSPSSNFLCSKCGLGFPCTFIKCKRGSPPYSDKKEAHLPENEDASKVGGADSVKTRICDNKTLFSNKKNFASPPKNKSAKELISKLISSYSSKTSPKKKDYSPKKHFTSPPKEKNAKEFITKLISNYGKRSPSKRGQVSPKLKEQSKKNEPECVNKLDLNQLNNELINISKKVTDRSNLRMDAKHVLKSDLVSLKDPRLARRRIIKSKGSLINTNKGQTDDEQKVIPLSQGTRNFLNELAVSSASKNFSCDISDYSLASVDTEDSKSKAAKEKALNAKTAPVCGISSFGATGLYPSLRKKEPKKILKDPKKEPSFYKKKNIVKPSKTLTNEKDSPSELKMNISLVNKPESPSGNVDNKTNMTSFISSKLNACEIDAVATVRKFESSIIDNDSINYELGSDGLNTSSSVDVKVKVDPVHDVSSASVDTSEIFYSNIRDTKPIYMSLEGNINSKGNHVITHAVVSNSVFKDDTQSEILPIDIESSVFESNITSSHQNDVLKSSDITGNSLSNVKKKTLVCEHNANTIDTNISVLEEDNELNINQKEADILKISCDSNIEDSEILTIDIESRDMELNSCLDVIDESELFQKGNNANESCPVPLNAPECQIPATDSEIYEVSTQSKIFIESTTSKREILDMSIVIPNFNVSSEIRNPGNNSSCAVQDNESTIDQVSIDIDINSKSIKDKESKKCGIEVIENKSLNLKNEPEICESISEDNEGVYLLNTESDTGKLNNDEINFETFNAKNELDIHNTNSEVLEGISTPEESNMVEINETNSKVSGSNSEFPLDHSMAQEHTNLSLVESSSVVAISYEVNDLHTEEVEISSFLSTDSKLEVCPADSNPSENSALMDIKSESEMPTTDSEVIHDADISSIYEVNSVISEKESEPINDMENYQLDNSVCGIQSTPVTKNIESDDNIMCTNDNFIKNSGSSSFKENVNFEVCQEGSSLVDVVENYDLDNSVCEEQSMPVSKNNESNDNDMDTNDDFIKSPNSSSFNENINLEVCQEGSSVVEINFVSVDSESTIDGKAKVQNSSAKSLVINDESEVHLKDAVIVTDESGCDANTSSEIYEIDSSFINVEEFAEHMDVSELEDYHVDSLVTEVISAHLDINRTTECETQPSGIEMVSSLCTTMCSNVSECSPVSANLQNDLKSYPGVSNVVKDSSNNLDLSNQADVMKQFSGEGESSPVPMEVCDETNIYQIVSDTVEISASLNINEKSTVLDTQPSFESCVDNKLTVYPIVESSTETVSVSVDRSNESDIYKIISSTKKTNLVPVDIDVEEIVSQDVSQFDGESISAPKGRDVSSETQQLYSSVEAQQYTPIIDAQLSDPCVDAEQSNSNVEAQQSDPCVEVQQFDPNVDAEQSNSNVEAQQSDPCVEVQQFDPNVEAEQLHPNVGIQQLDSNIEAEQLDPSDEAQQSDTVDTETYINLSDFGLGDNPDNVQNILIIQDEDGNIETLYVLQDPGDGNLVLADGSSIGSIITEGTGSLIEGTEIQSVVVNDTESVIEDVTVAESNIDNNINVDFVDTSNSNVESNITSDEVISNPHDTNKEENFLAINVEQELQNLLIAQGISTDSLNVQIVESTLPEDKETILMKDSFTTDTPIESETAADTNFEQLVFNNTLTEMKNTVEEPIDRNQTSSLLLNPEKDSDSLQSSPSPTEKLGNDKDEILHLSTLPAQQLQNDSGETLHLAAVPTQGLESDKNETLQLITPSTQELTDNKNNCLHLINSDQKLENDDKLHLTDVSIQKLENNKNSSHLTALSAHELENSKCDTVHLSALLTQELEHNKDGNLHLSALQTQELESDNHDKLLLTDSSTQELKNNKNADSSLDKVENILLSLSQNSSEQNATNVCNQNVDFINSSQTIAENEESKSTANTVSPNQLTSISLIPNSFHKAKKRTTKSNFESISSFSDNVSHKSITLSQIQNVSFAITPNSETVIDSGLNLLYDTEDSNKIINCESVSNIVKNLQRSKKSFRPENLLKRSAKKTCFGLSNYSGEFVAEKSNNENDETFMLSDSSVKKRAGSDLYGHSNKRLKQDSFPMTNMDDFRTKNRPIALKTFKKPFTAAKKSVLGENVINNFRNTALKTFVPKTQIRRTALKTVAKKGCLKDVSVYNNINSVDASMKQNSSLMHSSDPKSFFQPEICEIRLLPNDYLKRASSLLLRRKKTEDETQDEVMSDEEAKCNSCCNSPMKEIMALKMPCSCTAKEVPCICNSEALQLTCEGEDSIDNNVVRCSNSVSQQYLLTPSTEIRHRAFCDIHLSRLRKHHCCPKCGLFCSQGEFLLCSSEELDNKRHHLFHIGCFLIPAPGLPPSCPHCCNFSNFNAVNLIYRLHTDSELKEVPSDSVNIIEDIDGYDIFMQKNLAPKVVTVSDSATFIPQNKEMHHMISALATEKTLRLRPTGKCLYNPIKTGDVQKVMQLIGNGVNPNHKFKMHSNNSPLHVAAYHGWIGILHILIQAGAFIDAVNDDLETPLIVAVEKKQLPIIRYLVHAGAEIDVMDCNGMTSFHIACKNGFKEVAEFLYGTGRVDVNLQDDGGWTALVWSCEHKHLDLVKWLLDVGANTNVRDNEENTVLHWAAYSGECDIAKLFLGKGCTLSYVNKHGDSALHIAARENNFECVELFVTRGAVLDQKNKNNETPLMCCDENSSSYNYIMQAISSSALKIRKLQLEKHVVFRDISRGAESIPIQAVNEVDDEEFIMEFRYVVKNCYRPGIEVIHTVNNMQFCYCKDNCLTCDCACTKNAKCFYDMNGCLTTEFDLVWPPIIYECNKTCLCPKTCINRVVQRGLRCPLQLFRTLYQGWGVRTLQDLPKGTFVCEYVGELITGAEAVCRDDDTYFFDLESQDSDYCLDGRFYGNIARFLNHSCEPNMIAVKVYVDHQDSNFPRIAFFTLRHIKAFEELCFDYGLDFWIVKSQYILCTCNTPSCKYSKDTIDETLQKVFADSKNENDANTETILQS